ncbi:MAG: DUF4878 domain-containing protein [Chitinophagaceae bacterium]|nr:DUF4878 domain-containing protein [Chitinophagaceae bacterium]
MKRILFALIITTGLFSCNSKDAGPSGSSPTGTIDGMFTAMKNGNIDDFKKFITKNDVAMIEEGIKFANSIDSSIVRKATEAMAEEFKEKVKNVSYKLKNEKITGDNATVDAEVTENGKTETHAFNLVKEDGAWKIALSKSGDGMFNSMKGNRGPGEPDLQEGIEKLKNMDKDSLKMLMEKANKFFDTLKARKGNL